MEFFAEFLHIPSRLILALPVSVALVNGICAPLDFLFLVYPEAVGFALRVKLAVSPLAVPEGSLAAFAGGQFCHLQTPTPAPSFPESVPRLLPSPGWHSPVTGPLVFKGSDFTINLVFHFGLSHVWTCPFFSRVKELAIYFYFPKCFYWKWMVAFDKCLLIIS